MRGTRSRPAALVILVVVLLAVAVAVAIAVLRPRTLAVGFVGDSITDGARADLHARFGVDDDDIEAVSGTRVADMLPAARALAGAHPKQVVINLGTNDVLSGEPLPDGAPAAPQLEEMVTTFLPDAACVHLVTVNEHMVSGVGQDLRTPAEAVNARMYELASRHPEVRVVDWAKLVRDDDASGNPGGPLTTDTVHPTELGRARLLDAVDASVAACPVPV